MPNTPATHSLPPSGRALPAPEVATPGRHIVIRRPKDADYSWPGRFRRERVGPTILVRLRPHADWRFQVLPRYSTALCARTGRKSGGRAPETSEAEHKLRQELVSYTRLGDNWDGDGAKAPSQEAVNDALTFLDGRPANIPLPYPEEGTEGDVGVYWDNRQAHVFAEVTFEGDRTCAYFAVHGVPGAVSEKCGSDDVDVTAPWPDDMLRILRMQDPA